MEHRLGFRSIVTNGVATIPAYKDANNPDGLLTLGGPANYSNANSWYNLNNARTVIGLSQDNNTLFLFTVDNAGGSRGMNLGEVANLLISDYGVYNALNLDGGGSTTMAFEDPLTGRGRIFNVSSDNPSGRARGKQSGRLCHFDSRAFHLGFGKRRFDSFDLAQKRPGVIS